MSSARKFSPSPALVLSAIALVAAAGGFAVAAVPDRQGRIEACYVPRTGAVKLLVKGTKCPRGQRLVRWSQTGPAGPPGTAGQNGAAGENGKPGQDGTPGAPGSPAGSLLTGNTENIPLTDGVTRWLAPSGPSQIWGAPTFAETLSPDHAIVARDLAIRLGDEPGADEAYVVTFQLDSLDTALTCTVSGLDETCGNTTAAVTVPPRSRIALKVEVTPGAINRRVLFGWRALTP
ncbi:MAG TPA: collagen-like protein [Thermoleophilaceae bacterium]|jgi:hypothetical protein